MSDTAQSKQWTVEEIRAKLESDYKWLFRGLIAIYKRQTADEQEAETTNHNNKIGFNGPDARFMSRMARKAMDPNDRGFTDKQVFSIRSKMLKYAGQLQRISSGQG